MRFDCYNFGELHSALQQYNDSEPGTGMVIVLHTPGDDAFRFIVSPHGIVRQQCNKRGDPIYHDP